MRSLYKGFIIVLIALFVASCSASYHCKKCFQNSNVSIDSTTSIVNVPVPIVLADTTVQLSGILYSGELVDSSLNPPLVWPSDTVYLQRDKLKVEVRFLPGRKIYISGACRADTLKIEVTKTIPIKVQTGVPRARVWLIGICAVVAGLFAGSLIMRVFR